METVEVRKYNEVNMIVSAPPSIKEELRQYFAFRPEGYKFNPKYKNKIWDGYIYLYKPLQGTLYLGLFKYVEKFCADRGYKLDVDPSIKNLENVEDDYAYQLAKELNAPFKPKEYQNDYVNYAISNNRAILKSPTSSGKSFLIYLLMNHYMLTQDSRILIVVPTVILVNQMYNDFAEYGLDSEEMIHRITSGVSKNTNKQIVITTWQSITKQSKEWFNSFDVVFGDEAHKFAAKSLIAIMEKMVNVKYRFGLTGSLKDSKVHKLVLEGLFGSITQYVTTREMIDAGDGASLKIKCLSLQYSKKECSELNRLKKKEMPNKRYHVESSFLHAHHKRNLFIRNLLWSIEGKNNVIIFDKVETHGRVLEPLLRKEGRTLHFIHGGKDSDDKDTIREICENSYGNDILASSGVFSTGVSIKRLDNLIYVGGGKSSIKIIQTIGRLLRIGNGSDETTMYDIMDALPYSGKPNYFLSHSIERIKIYKEEQHDYKIINIEL